MTQHELTVRSSQPEENGETGLQAKSGLAVATEWTIPRHRIAQRLLTASTNVDDVQQRHQRALHQLPSAAAFDRLCELNVIEQARHVCETTVVQDAWARGAALVVHGWIYGLRDGRLHDLGFAAARPHEVELVYQRAVGGTLVPVE
jgi:hypothetical protein